MTLPRVQLDLKDGFLPVEPLRELVRSLAPHREYLLDEWRNAYRRTFVGGGFFTPGQLEEYLAAELDLLIDCVGGGTLTDLWARLSEAGRRYADAGVPYSELVITMSLLEESLLATLRRNGASARDQLDSFLVFDKLSHYRITKLAEAYFYRYVELIQEKTRELADEQEKHEWSMMRAEKLAGLGQLAGGIAHELNNPLATIAITVEDLQDALRLEAREVGQRWPELAPALDRVRSSVTRCIGIIGGMMDLVRNRPPTIEVFRPNDLITRVSEVIAYPSRLAGKTVTLELAPELDTVKSDPRQLEQVVMALVSNGLDAVDMGGEVVVRTAMSGDRFRVEVEDNGCGIPEENQVKIFEPFFTTKPPGKGTGLGLSVADSTVRRLKGQLTLKSAVGRGTKVAVSLPLTNEDVG